VPCLGEGFGDGEQHSGFPNIFLSSKKAAEKPKKTRKEFKAKLEDICDALASWK